MPPALSGETSPAASSNTPTEPVGNDITSIAERHFSRVANSDKMHDGHFRQKMAFMSKGGIVVFAYSTKLSKTVKGRL